MAAVKEEDAIMQFNETVIDGSWNEPTHRLELTRCCLTTQMAFVGTEGCTRVGCQ